MTNDPVGDLLVRLEERGRGKKDDSLYSVFGIQTRDRGELRDAGYIAGIEKKGKKVRKTLDVTLKYKESGAPIIRGARRISKPGRRMYRSVHEIMPIRYGHGSLILSTPKGIKTDKEARKEKIGGEALFEIW